MLLASCHVYANSIFSHLKTDKEVKAQYRGIQNQEECDGYEDIAVFREIEICKIHLEDSVNDLSACAPNDGLHCLA